MLRWSFRKELDRELGKLAALDDLGDEAAQEGGEGVQKSQAVSD